MDDIYTSEINVTDEDLVCGYWLFLNENTVKFNKNKSVLYDISLFSISQLQMMKYCEKFNYTKVFIKSKVDRLSENFIKKSVNMNYIELLECREYLEDHGYFFNKYFDINLKEEFILHVVINFNKKNKFEMEEIFKII